MTPWGKLERKLRGLKIKDNAPKADDTESEPESDSDDASSKVSRSSVPETLDELKSQNVKELLILDPEDLPKELRDPFVKLRRDRLWEMVHDDDDILTEGYPGQGAIQKLTASTSSDVPLQQVHSGPYIISDKLANTQCEELGVTRLLKKLNAVQGTDYELRGTRGLKACLQRYVDDKEDFGTAYGMLRPFWDEDDGFRDLASVMDERRTRDAKMRSAALVGGRIANPRIPPRRVWDLQSNRVLPFWVISRPRDAEAIPKKLWAVSHCWVADGERKNVWTSINQEEWRVPIPKDTSLENIRIELLNLGAEYVWLDVLCLRQGDDGPPGERKMEWKLDVPTIGYMYQREVWQTVVAYFSGLGRPFTLDNHLIRSERHWLNRAWTVQETMPNWLPGGLTKRSPDEHGAYKRTPSAKQFYKRLLQLAEILDEDPPDFFAVIGIMRGRFHTSPADAVHGVSYLLNFKSLPSSGNDTDSEASSTKTKNKRRRKYAGEDDDADDDDSDSESEASDDDEYSDEESDDEEGEEEVYDEDATVEEAWNRCIAVLTPRHRADMLFLFPEQGDGPAKWRPSWRQLMDCEDVPYSPFIRYRPYTLVKEKNGQYYNRGYLIENCKLRGFDSIKNGRKGTLIIRKKSVEERFPLVAKHTEPIPDGRYAMVGCDNMRWWVVGRLIDGPKPGRHGEKEYKVEKVSVLRMRDATARGELSESDPGERVKVYYT